MKMTRNEWNEYVRELTADMFDIKETRDEDGSVMLIGYSRGEDAMRYIGWDQEENGRFEAFVAEEYCTEEMRYTVYC